MRYPVAHCSTVVHEIAHGRRQCYITRMKPPSKKVTPPALPGVGSSNIRWRPEDQELIAALQKKTGIGSMTDLARLALRALAQKEGIQ